MNYYRWPDEQHVSHKNVISILADLYDCVCTDCGAKNSVIGGWDYLRVPCDVYVAHVREQELLDKVKSKLYVSTSRGLIVCPTCKGRGITSEEVCISYHNNDYETKYSSCSKCNCTGKIIETTISVRVPNDLEEKTSRPATQQDIDAMIDRGYL